MNKTKSNIFKLGIPIFIQLFLFNLLNSLDTLMISSYNENLVLSINNAVSVVFMINVLLAICSTGVGIVISQYLGAKKQEDAKIAFNNGLMFNFALSILLMIILLIFQRQLLGLIDCPEEYVKDAMTYISITAIGIPCNGLINIFSANLRSYQKPTPITIIAILSNIINVFLNYVFIFGNFSMPELGIAGAAIGTVTSQIITTIVSFVITPILLKYKIYSFKISFFHLKKVLYIGLPSALETFCYTLSTLFVTAAVNQLIKEEMLSRTYINMIMTYIYQFSVAFGSANAILVGYNVGKGEQDAAKKETYKSFFMCYPVLLIIITILNIFGRDIMYMICKDMESVDLILDITSIILPWIFLYETGRCINLIFINALKATGDVFFPLICAIISMFLFSSLGSWVLGIYLKLGFLGVFLAQALDECFRGVIMIIHWQRDKWKTKAIIK